MRRRVLILLTCASVALAACGGASEAIVFDSTTAAVPTTPLGTAPVAATTPGASTTASVAVSAEPPSGGGSSGSRTTSGPSGEEPSADAGPDDALIDDDPTTAPATATGSACAAASCSGAQIVPYPTLTEVPQLGKDPARGSGCGLADEFGTTMPDGLYFGLLYPEGDAAGFDVICVYYGDSAVDKGADPGPPSDFFPLNSATRQRDVSLADDFVYRVGSWTPDGQCVDAGPAGNAEWTAVDDGTAAWLTITGGDATGAVAMCPL